MLTAMGAEVIKVEEPVGGDYLRAMPPAGPRGNIFFERLHRGQRSLAVDIRDARGRQVVMGLAARADVLLEGFRPGVMERLGLGYDALSEANPRLIYCSLTAYGQADRAGDADRRAAAHDLNIVALSGLLSYMKDRSGWPMAPPLQLADVAAGGMLAVTAVLAALIERWRTGRGQRLDVAMLDGLRILGVLQRTEGAVIGCHPAREDLPLAGNLACYNVYRTAEGGAVALGALEPKFWSAFCEGVGRPDWVARQFAPAPAQQALMAEVAAVFAARTRRDWEEFAGRCDCCLTPVLEPGEAETHPLTEGRPPDDVFPVATRPGKAAVKGIGGIGAAATMAASSEVSRDAAPELGQDTVAILQELGYPDENIRAWAEAGIIRAGRPRLSGRSDLAEPHQS